MKKVSVILVLALFVMSGSAWAGMNENPWYVKIAGGYVIPFEDYDEERANATEWAFDNGFSGHASVGYEWGTWGIELEGNYKTLDADFRTTKATAVETATSGDQTHLSGMVNLFAILMADKPISTYFGGGIGMTQIEWDNVLPTGGTAIDDSDTVFTWQLIAGVSFDINQNIALELDYRYVRPGDIELNDTAATFYDFNNQHLHNITLGFKFRF